MRPPRWVERLLLLCVPSGLTRDSVVGDMEEEFALRAVRETPAAARWWYRRQAVGIAVGAQRRDFRSLVFGEGVRLVGGGVVIGAIVSLGVARALRSLLYEIEAGDPVTFGIALLLFAVVTTLACWAPTRRALRVDPAEALRSE